MMAFNRSHDDQHFLQRNTAPLDPVLEACLSNPQLFNATAPGPLPSLPHSQRQQFQHPFGSSSSYIAGAEADLATLQSRLIARSLLAARIRAAQHAQDMERVLLRNVTGSSSALRLFGTPGLGAAPGPVSSMSMIQSTASLPAAQTADASSGLELLRSVSLGLSDNHTLSALPPRPAAPPLSGLSRKLSESQQTTPATLPKEVYNMSLNDSQSVDSDKSNKKPSSRKGATRLYVDDIREWDVLCGRGGRSNHHPGNKRYRNVVSEMKAMYRTTEAKTVKTDLSRAIVEHVCNYGGRFIKKDESMGRYYLLTKAEARKKTSQALRETKELKWTL